MNAPLHNGNPRHALAAPRFAVRAPNKTVTKPSATAIVPTNPGREPGGEPVPVFDQRRQVEEREQPAVAQRPVLAAPETRTGNADDGAEDDEQVGAGGSEPGEPREASRHGCGIYARE